MTSSVHLGLPQAPLPSAWLCGGMGGVIWEVILGSKWGEFRPGAQAAQTV